MMTRVQSESHGTTAVSCNSATQCLPGAVQSAERQVPLVAVLLLHAVPSGKLVMVHSPVRGTQVAFWHAFEAAQGVWRVTQ